MTPDNQLGSDRAGLTRRSFMRAAGIVGIGTGLVAACEALEATTREAATIVATLEKIAIPEPTATTPPTKEMDPWHKYGELAQKVWSQNPNPKAPRWDELTPDIRSRVEHLVGYALTEDGRDPQNVGLNPVGRMALPENVFATAQTLITPDGQEVTRVQLVVKDASDPEGSIQPGDMIYLRPGTENTRHPNHSLVRTTEEGTHIDWVVVGEQGDFRVVPREVDSNGRTVRVAFDENANRFNQNVGAVPSTGSAAGGPESTVNIITDASGMPTAAAIKFEAGAGSVTDVPLSISELKDQSGETAGFGLSTPEGTPVAHKYGRQPWKFIVPEPEKPKTENLAEAVRAWKAGETTFEPDMLAFSEGVTHGLGHVGQANESPAFNIQGVLLGTSTVKNNTGEDDLVITLGLQAGSLDHPTAGVTDNTKPLRYVVSCHTGTANSTFFAQVLNANRINFGQIAFAKGDEAQKDLSQDQARSLLGKLRGRPVVAQIGSVAIPDWDRTQLRGSKSIEFINAQVDTARSARATIGRLSFGGTNPNPTGATAFESVPNPLPSDYLFCATFFAALPND